MPGEALARIVPGDAEYFLQVRPRTGGASLSGAQITQLAEACGWLRLSGSDWWTGRYQRRSYFMEIAAKVLGERSLYGLNVSNGRTLERRLKSWQEQAHQSLLPKHFGNNNARKAGAVQIKRLIDLYGTPIKPSVAKVTEIINREALQYGWPQLSEERVRQILRLPENLQICTLARHGRDAARNAQERNFQRRRPSHADAMWIIDGSTIQLYYLDENGKVCSDLYAVAIADGYSQAIIGYAIGYTETGTLVQAALRKAARTTGMAPYQLQYDNSSANKGTETQQVMEALAHLHFPTAPYSGKAKVIEAIWGRMEQGFLHSFPNFKGGNITARSVNSRANPDHLAALKKSGNLPGRDAVIAQFQLAIETLNNTAGKKDNRTPAERYRDAHEARTPISDMMMMNAFWVDRKHPARYTKDGVVIEVDGERHAYEVEKERGVECMEFRLKWLGETFTVKYDPDDLEYIALYQDGAHIATARKKYQFAMAVADLNEGEGEIVHKALESRREYWQVLEERREDIDADMRAMGFEAINFRLIHKDALNRMEGEALDNLLEAAAVIPTKTKEKPVRVRLYDDSDADGSIIS
jgi:hypothetical protein